MSDNSATFKGKNYLKMLKKPSHIIISRYLQHIVALKIMNNKILLFFNIFSFTFNKT